MRTEPRHRIGGERAAQSERHRELVRDAVCDAIRTCDACARDRSSRKKGAAAVEQVRVRVCVCAGSSLTAHVSFAAERSRS
jgi:hypothetical protein